MIRIVGLLFVIRVAGATTAVRAEVAVGADWALALPSALIAVTRTRIVCPTSAPVRTRVLSVAPATLTQPALDVSHRSHWYWKLVGLFCQLPFCAVRVSPCRGVPLIVGGLVFTGAA